MRPLNMNFTWYAHLYFFITPAFSFFLENAINFNFFCVILQQTQRQEFLRGTVRIGLFECAYHVGSTSGNISMAQSE